MCYDFFHVRLGVKVKLKTSLKVFFMYFSFFADGICFLMKGSFTCDI